MPSIEMNALYHFLLEGEVRRGRKAVRVEPIRGLVDSFLLISSVFRSSFCIECSRCAFDVSWMLFLAVLVPWGDPK